MMNRLLLCLLPCLATVAFAQKENLCPEGTTQKTMTYTAGIKDAYREPTDPSTRGKELDGLFEYWTDFDELRQVGPVGYTFTDLPCYIVDAQLIIRAKPNGESSRDDSINIGFDGKQWFWRMPFEALLRTEWVREEAEFTLSLNELGLLDLLNSKHQLDVMIEDATTVDYIELVIIYCDFEDCNNNCVPDDQDIASGTSADINRNGIPDECEDVNCDFEDCNENCVPDDQDIASGTSKDINGNGIPDECEVIITPPVFTCPDDVIVVATGPCCEEVSLAPIVENLEGTPVITNSIDPSQGGNLTWCFPVGVTTAYFTLYPPNQPPITCSVTIVVTDNRGPVIMPRLQL